MVVCVVDAIFERVECFLKYLMLGMDMDTPLVK